jgi:6-pyruvoyl-tetrahydropterin synthase
MAPDELFEVRVEVGFRATHSVGPDGGATGAHEHRWLVAVRARSERLDAIAIVVDFRKLRDDAERIVAELDGTELEQNPALAGGATTAAAVAEWILQRLEPTAGTGDYRIVAVEVECDAGIRWVTGRESVAARRPV